MSLSQRVYSVLVVSSSEKFDSIIARLLPKAEFSPIHFADSIAAAKRKIIEKQYDIVIINTPMPDDFGRKFAIDVCSSSNSVAMLVVKNEVYDDLYLEIVGFGVFALRKPTSAQMIAQAVDYMRATRERLRRLEKKTVSLEDKMAEIRTVNRAKWALIEACHMTESDAHRYIEKMAMDRCTTRREIAENILQTYKPS